MVFLNGLFEVNPNSPNGELALLFSLPRYLMQRKYNRGKFSIFYS
jgi:hypothetical protein